MKDEMKELYDRYLSVCLENPNKPSLIWMISAIVIFFPYSTKIDDEFKNKYMCADLAVLLYIYTMKKIKEEKLQVFNDNEKQFLIYINKGIRHIYGITLEEMTLIELNRLPYFRSLLDNEYPDISQFYLQAKKLFDYDLIYNCVIEFKEDLPILDVVELFPEIKLKNYFNIAFEMILDLIDDYKHLISNTSQKKSYSELNNSEQNTPLYQKDLSTYVFNKSEKNSTKMRKSNIALKTTTIILSICLLCFISVSVYLNHQYIELGTQYHTLETSVKMNSEKIDDVFNTITQNYSIFYSEDESTELYGGKSVYHCLSNPCSVYKFKLMRDNQNSTLDNITFSNEVTAQLNGYSPCPYCY